MTWTVLLLLLLYTFFIPSYNVLGLNIKKIDILSDIKNNPPANDTTPSSLPTDIANTTNQPDTNTLTSPIDTNITQQNVSPTPIPSPASTTQPRTTQPATTATPTTTPPPSAYKKAAFCVHGVLCIEDYSPNGKALDLFVQALKKSKFRKVRVAVFGDSFIEGDMMMGDLRDSLQSAYGGYGVGFVPITSRVNKYRISVDHKFNTWKTLSILDGPAKTTAYGPAGYTYLPSQGSKVSYKATKYYKHTDKFKSIRIFYSHSKGQRIEYTLNGEKPQIKKLATGDALQYLDLGTTAEATSVEFKVLDGGEVRFYGASLEGDNGLYIDNFSTRGNSGRNLTFIDEAMFKAFNKFQDYKLIVLEFGLNVNAHKATDVKWYEGIMEEYITHMKRAFPNSSFLLVSISDRSENQNGKFVTMPMIPVMVESQRQMAKKMGIAFYDLFSAMGGYSSMVNYVNHKPPLANKDYTHLTFAGGKRIAGTIAKSIIYEEKRYK